MIETTAIRDDQGALLVSTAEVATPRSANYADLLAELLGRKVPVEPLPGGYRLDFGIGEGLLNFGPESLSLMVIAYDGAALCNLRDALAVHLERLGHRDGLRVVWR
ncbi:hypothetical protein GCM10009853_091780 [Glycomyces scopariae]|uniref:DUF2218 domain-containing protein n=1 Tax=Glycomyces sambucus TaxID=380244 RepID=A0A1G9FGT2_9ACTN|nr:DUF2218 domain-containing protein [Glycomyces sambucus]SDK87562.1 hypothetical protein SAMN05216298_1780 [Glycomyces sambucus]